ncbi:hypothetical protein M5G20_19795 [Pseudomonas sp. TNT2022 ID1044]|uniref:hypothetical protein n=1 Tax=Pseudomonas sp. TNT2022 ID1044 TaxID=2942636 RepID=UPI0023629CB1|nr:hypothetical protein [Pseudomonas sp. TNT2022 ID1044]MDD0998091.1 hypothetical protein [Pseudomonas sp. TNT2022 ID1044]
MKKPKEKIVNPITVIAIFATLSETSAAITLPFLDNKEREIYIWFLISFPFYLLLLFFATLNFNYRSLYAPSDYEKGEHFIEVLGDMEHRENESADVRQASRPPTAQAPPDENATWMDFFGEQGVQLPESASDLRIIDARHIHKRSELGALCPEIQKSREKQLHVILFIADSKSEKWLKESAFNLSRQASKRSSATFFAIYNLSSQKVTVIRTCH